MDYNANKFFIPNILGVDNSQDFSIDNIIAAREVRDSINSDWIGKEPIVFADVNNISLNKSRFVVNTKSIWYECLFLPNKTSDTLVVSLSGGGRSINNRYPRFLRWKYANKLQVNMLCIDDPMYKGNNDRGVRWYYGTKETSYLKEMVPIIKRVSDILNIPCENIFFIGSSGGGYAANYLANIMDGTNAISMNPQFLPMNWKNGKIMEIFKQSYSIDLSNMNDIHNRNNFTVTAKNSFFLEIINASSKDDYEFQFLPFCKNNNIIPHYGLSHKDNVITWLHCTDAFSLHSANPTDLGILISMSLLRYFRKTHDISSCYNLSLVINEELRSKYEIKKELSNIQYWKKSLSSMYYNLPNTVTISLDLEKNHVDFFLKDFVKVNIKNIYFTLHKTIERKVISDEDDDVLKFYYGICIVNEPQIINDENFYEKISDFAKKFKLHIRKSQKNMKLLSSSRKVESATKKLYSIIERSCEELTDIYSQFKLNVSDSN